MQLFIEAIHDEEKSRNMENRELLDKALERKGLQNKKLTEKEKDLIAEAFSIQKDMEGEEKKKEILEEIQQARQIEASTRSLELRERIKELNDKKFSYQKQKEELLRKKALFYEKVKRGDDYMQEIHGPNQPPIEFIDMNLNVNVDDYREEYSREQVLEISKKIKENGEKRIAELKRQSEAQQQLILQQMEAGEAEQEAMQVDMDKLMELNREKEYLEQQLSKLNEKMYGSIGDRVIRMIAEEKVETVILKMIGEIAMDFAKIDSQIKDQTQDILLKVLNQGRKQPVSTDQFSQIYDKLLQDPGARQPEREGDDIELRFTVSSARARLLSARLFYTRASFTRTRLLCTHLYTRLYARAGPARGAAEGGEEGGAGAAQQAAARKEGRRLEARPEARGRPVDSEVRPRDGLHGGDPGAL